MHEKTWTGIYNHIKTHIRETHTTIGKHLEKRNPHTIIRKQSITDFIPIRGLDMRIHPLVNPRSGTTYLFNVLGYYATQTRY